MNMTGRASRTIDLLYDPEDGSDVPQERHLTFDGLHSITSEKTELFITTAERALYETSSIVLFVKMLIGYGK
jgi:hypothetical protein